jgi:hypothetical protein
MLAVAVAYWPTLRGRLTNGEVILESVPAGAQAYVDGQLVGVTPLSLALPSGTHQVEFRNGSASRQTKVVVVARGRVIEHVDWLQKPTGSLRVTEPAGARVSVDGTPRGSAPVTIDELSPGTHAVTIESAAGSIRRSVKVDAGQTADLRESIFSGWLAVFSPFEISINEGGRRIVPDERGRVMLSPGSHKLRLQNTALGYDEERTINIQPAETTALNVTPQTSINVTSSEPADVSIDGTRAGATPWKGSIRLGSHTVVLKTSAGAQRRLDVTATTKGVQLDVDFSR